MKKLFILGLLVPSLSFSQTIFDDFNDFLSNHVVFGLVDYAELAKDPEELNDLVSKINTHNLADSSEDYKTAFYINSYNILVIKQVVNNYPIKSPMEVEGFFNKIKFVLAGEELTLDEIEFQKLIKRINDPRIHFALGCGARSCPFLYNQAFNPDDLENQLEFRAEQIIERPNYVFVENETKTVTINKIFDWYGDQFVASAGSLIKYVNQYKSKKVPEVYLVKFQEYDWSLNDR